MEEFARSLLMRKVMREFFPEPNYESNQNMIFLLNFPTASQFQLPQVPSELTPWFHTRKQAHSLQPITLRNQKDRE